MSAPSADETAADAPVRDIASARAHAAHGPQAAQHGRAGPDVARVPREDLEDRYLRLHEENLLLKHTNNSHEDKIRRLATKLVKLAKDRRRLEQLVTGGAPANARPAGRTRDVEMEEVMEELHEEVRGLQAENQRLKQRLLVAKQQAQVQSRRPSPYGRIQACVDTGRRRTREDSPSPSRLQQRGARSIEDGVRPPAGALPRYGHSLLEEARAEIRNLENLLEGQRGQLEELEGGAHLLREQLRRKETEHQEALGQLRQHHTDGQRVTVSSNIAMIRLQKQLAERCGAVTALEGRFLQLQEGQKALKGSHQALLERVEEVTGELKEERLRSLRLENQLHTSNFSQSRTEELQVRISDLEKERDLLKENCDQLVNRAFDVSQQQRWRLQEQQLRVQIGQLETALQADLTDKNQILDKMKDERDANDKLTEENRRLQIQFLEQRQQLEDLNERLKFYTKESGSGAGELNEALALIRARRARQSGDLSFLEQVEKGERSGDSQSSMDLRAAHAETIQELEKTRGLLLIQNKINQDYREELDAFTRKTESDKTEYEVKLEQAAKLLDSRAAKIKKLEVQLRDMAYGTKAYVFKPDAAADAGATDPLAQDAEARLQRGENVLELHLGRATLSSAALVALGGAQQAFFCTYGFYDAELHATPVVDGGGGGGGPDFDFTSRYVVRMDELFMEYLHSGWLGVELHLAQGLAFRTLARGQLRLGPLLEQDGTAGGALPLAGVSVEQQCWGSLQFWVRLKEPMQQTLRLYRERRSALGYILTAPGPDSPAGPQNGVNVLEVSVQRCSDLPTSGPGEPSPYVFYKFYDFPYRDTAVVHDQRHPAFSHRTPYAVAMDAALDRYLRSEELPLYVLNHKEECLDAYLGKARVPLLRLAHDQAVSGEFELSSPSGAPAGRIEVTLRWKDPYRPPPGITVGQDTLVPQDPLAGPAHETPMEDQEEEEEEESLPLAEERKTDGEVSSRVEVGEEEASDPGSKAPLPKPRQQTRINEVVKKVSFLQTDDFNQQDEGHGLPAEKKGSAQLPRIQRGVPEVSPAPPSGPHEEDEEDEEEVSQVSEGQMIPASSQSYSDHSEMSEESIAEDIAGAPSVLEGGQALLSDSDECIVPRHGSAGTKTSERLRVEIVSVNLRPEARAAHDPSVVRLFVEYSLLDLPSEETPLSLPKPAPGQTVHYNYSNVIHVDPENNRPRRELLRGVLEGRNAPMESIRFTLVSEPPEEEEQERECEDVGVAYLRITDILVTQQDLMESRLDVVEVEDSSVVMGTLTVSVEALDALRSIMDDPEHDYTPVTRLQEAS